MSVMQRRLGCGLLCFIFLTATVGRILAQQQLAPLVTAPIDDSVRTVLHGNTYPLAIARFDRGAAPDSLPMERMLLVLKRSDAQEAALRKLLDDQQNNSSPNYHKWLTPEEFGKQFGPSDADLQAVTGWLQKQGFEVTKIATGRTVIEFRGTAGTVKNAFHTSIHQFAVSGKSHWANASDPQIPSALASAVAGIWSLHNFEKKPDLVMSKERFRIVKGTNGKPQANGSNGSHALGQGDYATIYGINPVYQSSIDGTNVNIAVRSIRRISPTSAPSSISQEARSASFSTARVREIWAAGKKQRRTLIRLGQGRWLPARTSCWWYRPLQTPRTVSIFRNSTSWITTSAM